MSDPLATVAMLAKRVGTTDLDVDDPEDVGLAVFMLEYASEQVRMYGRADWSPMTVPPVVRLLTVEVASRGYLNPSGYKLERGDELTLQRDDISTDGCTLTKSEIALVRQAAYRNGMTSIILIRPDQLSDDDARNGGGGGGSSFGIG